jgi:FKBP-type peptidyl-prolyl cis-trans isomerase
VAYVGTFPGTNQVFDRRDAGNPLTFRMGGKDLIKGFSLGIATMHTGGKRRVLVPPELAYGAAGKPSGNIPGGQALIFEIELLSIKGEAITITLDDLPKFEPLGPPAPTNEPATRP